MARLILGAAVIASVGLSSVGCSTAGAPGRAGDEPGFVTLFDGTGMDGWEIYLEKDEPIKQDAFYLEDGTLACKGYGYYWFRYKKRQFDNFVLRLEFKVAKDTNSGVCVRTLEKGAPPFTGFEIQICDDYGEPPHKNGTGAIYDVVTPTVNASRPAGEWNELELTCDGQRVRVVLNGQKVIDTDFSKFTMPIGKFETPYANLPKIGYIALQDHWTPIWYRNIRIKEL